MLQQHSKISSERGAGREGVVRCGKTGLSTGFSTVGEAQAEQQASCYVGFYPIYLITANER